MGTLVPIYGTDPQLGEWTHSAFIPTPLPSSVPELSAETYLSVLKARAALSALDATAKQLPNPTLLRLPTLRREAQSTSALEGTYAPLADVLTADEDAPATPELIEVLNYVSMANIGFDKVASGFPISVTLICELQAQLMRGTQLEELSGQVRDRQVVIGQRTDADPQDFPARKSRFVPAPPGLTLESGVRDLTDWMRQDHSAAIDPVIAAAMSHYQFETLHPFMDGNGRVGRYLIVLHLQATGVLSEPTLTVSPWFEARRAAYYDHLLTVSTDGDWNGYVKFFADGLSSAAEQTKNQMIALVSVQARLKEQVRASHLRADSAHALVDLAIANPSLTIAKVETELGLSYGRANKLVNQLADLGILQALNPAGYKRRYYAPSVLAVLTS
ncbi:Fic family protein [Leucobacter insecticola]|uniref:Fic family protein n=1 Tax=Leucobacter insecticola TaxID=2714934 RepID=A0A6G8FL21_9MICO|nr:Fic family protein [Leucobacter insecticola]QIM17051.1 Fic family protein [Leucobacter insecticola]